METPGIFLKRLIFKICLCVMCYYRSLGVGPFLPPGWGSLLFLWSSVHEAGWTSSFSGPLPPNVHAAISVFFFFKCGFWISTSDHQACSASTCPSAACFNIIFFLKNGHHEDTMKTTLCWLLRECWMVDGAWVTPAMATVIAFVVLTWCVCSVSFSPQKCHSMQIYHIYIPWRLKVII